MGKHEEICAKTANKKRKAYDSTKKRVLGTDAEKFVMKPKKKGGRGAMAVTNINSDNSNKVHTKTILHARSRKRLNVLFRVKRIF